jgi:hypothetical protein
MKPIQASQNPAGVTRVKDKLGTEKIENWAHCLDLAVEFLFSISLCLRDTGEACITEAQVGWLVS